MDARGQEKQTRRAVRQTTAERKTHKKVDDKKAVANPGKEPGGPAPPPSRLIFRPN